MRVAELMGGLARRGAYLRVLDGGRVEYIGLRGLLTDDLRSEIQARRDEIVDWLRIPIHALPKEDQLAFDYEPTLPPDVLDAIFADWPLPRECVESDDPLIETNRFLKERKGLMNYLCEGRNHLFVRVNRKVTREELIRLSAQLVAQFGEQYFEVGEDGFVLFEDPVYVFNLQLAHAHARGELGPDGRRIKEESYAVVAKPSETLVHVRLAWMDESAPYCPEDTGRFLGDLAECLRSELSGRVYSGWINWQPKTGFAYSHETPF